MLRSVLIMLISVSFAFNAKAQALIDYIFSNIDIITEQKAGVPEFYALEWSYNLNSKFSLNFRMRDVDCEEAYPDEEHDDFSICISIFGTGLSYTPQPGTTFSFMYENIHQDGHKLPVLGFGFNMEF